ncbi:unnamed protein product [Boreogadus saida]
MELSEASVNAVKMSKERKKLIRKQMKSCHILLKHDGIRTASHVTKSLVVANGGLGNGVSREQLCAAMREMGELETIIMSPHKPYAFATYSSEQSAQKAHGLLNGHLLHCGDNSVTLYLSFVDSVPCEAEEHVPLPEGLSLVEDFVSSEEEALLLAAVDWVTFDDETAQKALKHRRVKHYGYEFRYDTNNVEKDKPLSVGLPDECVPILERCLKDGHIGAMPDQLTVNQYQPGQGIPPHVDTHSAFEDTILSLSLGSKTVMEFRHPDGRVVAVLLPGRSLLVMKGESRHLWSHGITPRKFDMVPACDTEPPAAITPDLGNPGNLTLSKRGTRTSFTFRRIRRSPCQCAFPSACDSQGAPSSLPSAPSLPRCQGDAARLEEEYVHRVYDAIAPHFSGTRHSPWPRVCDFLSSLVPGAVLADVGCGNGKYLGVNPEVVALGCDRSSALVHICAERGFQAFVSDALNVPMLTASCDACISIAVIHHFSTPERRLAAVRELMRLLKPGGRALIYVWALEQEYNKQRSKYLKHQSREPSGSPNTAEGQSEGSASPKRTVNSHGDVGITNVDRLDTEVSGPVDQRPGEDQVHHGKLSVHTNRTAFNSQDLLVPWHLKDGKGKAGKGRKGGREAGNRDMIRETALAVPKDNPSISENILPSIGPASDCKTEPTDSNQRSKHPDSMSAKVATPNACLDSSLPSSTKDTDHACKSCPGFEATATPAIPESSTAAAVFHRYYHVFQQGEIEKVCCQVDGVKVQTSYHDQGNWCVILVKD